jgi:hypothetical protein
MLARPSQHGVSDIKNNSGSAESPAVEGDMTLDV